VKTLQRGSMSVRSTIFFLAASVSSLLAGCPLAVDDAYEFDDGTPADEFDAGLGRADEASAADAGGDATLPSQKQPPECSGGKACRNDTACEDGDCGDD
jgi:hypothetical protein